MAECFTILKRITRFKCVNSDIKSVRIHLKKGSLKWVHGTMSGHHGNRIRQELDHCSDPSGTESQNVHLNKTLNARGRPRNNIYRITMNNQGGKPIIETKTRLRFKESRIYSRIDTVEPK